MNLTWWCSGGSGQPWTWTYTPFLGAWALAGSVVVAYARAHRSRGGATAHPFDPVRVRRLAFGLAALTIASEWPLAPLGAGYSATVSMVRMVLYSMVAAPLLVAAIPPWLGSRMVKHPAAGALARAVTRWPVAYAVYNITLVAVNAPVTVDAMKTTQLGSFILDAALVGASLLLWYPVFGDIPGLARLGDPARAVYVLGQSVIPIFPASFLTFSRYPLYRIYELAPPFLNGFDPVSDQQIAGIVLKVLGGFVLLGFIAVLFFRWAARETHL